MNPPVLIVLTGKHKGKRFKLTEPETLVGRDEDAKLRIASSRGQSPALPAGHCA